MQALISAPGYEASHILAVLASLPGHPPKAGRWPGSNVNITGVIKPCPHYNAVSKRIQFAFTSIRIKLDSSRIEPLASVRTRTRFDSLLVAITSCDVSNSSPLKAL